MHGPTERRDGAVLVLVGENDQARVHHKSLRFYGYRVEMAHERIAGLTSLLAKPVDVVLAHPSFLDEAFLQRLRQHPQTEGMGVVLLADRSDLATRVESLNAGADYVLPHDVDAAELDAVLQRLLHQRGLREQAIVDREHVVAVLHALSQAVLLIDETGRVALANEAAYRILELQPDIVRLWTFDQILLAMGVPGHLARRWASLDQEQFEEVVEGQLGERALCVRVRSSAVELPRASHGLRVVVLEDLSQDLPSAMAPVSGEVPAVPPEAKLA